MPARELFELKYGKALVRTHRRPGNVPVYGTNGRCGTHAEALFPGPGVVIGRKGQGPLGVEWCDEPHWVIDTAYSLVPLRHDVDLKFAYYLIKHIGLNHLKDGTSNPSLSRDTFGAQALPLPPLDVQRRIARILGSLDDKMDLNRRMNGILESIAHAVFQSWFVDFDPIKSAASGSDGTAPDWPLVPFADTVEILSGGTPRTNEPDYWGGDVPWYSVADAPPPGDVFVVRTEKTITDDGVENSAAQVVPSLTTIISARGTVGKCALSGRPMAFNQSCFGLRPADGRGDYYTYLSTLQVVDQLRRSAHGSVFSTITRPTFAAAVVPLPPPGLVAQFERVVRPLMKRVLLNVRESETLLRTRDALLPRLLSGELAQG